MIIIIIIDVTNSLPKQILTYHQRCSLAIHKQYSWLHDYKP